jgi:hypothetical protein
MEYFVSEKWLKDNMPISDNSDPKMFYFNVKTVSDMRVRNILGTLFYNDLLVKYNAQNLSPNELILVDIMRWTIAWRSASESVISLSYQIFNKGVQTQFGDYSNNAEFKEISFLKHHYSDKASFYEKRLFDFLVDNKDDYPLLMDADNKDSEVQKHICKGGFNPYDSNIIFI